MIDVNLAELKAAYEAASEASEYAYKDADAAADARYAWVAYRKELDKVEKRSVKPVGEDD